MSELIYLGEDLGMGGNKLFGEHGGVQVLSQVAVNGTAHLADPLIGSGKKKKPMEIQSEAGSFYVGESSHDYGIPIENQNFDRLIGTSEIRSLFYAVLTKYQQQFGVFKAPLSLMVGLPLQMLIGPDAKEYKKGVKTWMSGIHEWRADGVQYGVVVEEVKLKPQAMGALFDYTYMHNGELIQNPETIRLWTEETAGLSIGFKTIEFLLTRESDDIARFTGGENMGVSRLLEDVNRRLSAKLGSSSKLFSLGELDIKLRNRKLDRDVLKVAMEYWSQQVTGVIESRWGEYFKRFAAVLVVGGGAELLRPYLESKFRGRAIVLDDPVMAISHGLYKMALKFRK